MVADFQQFYGLRIGDVLDGLLPAQHVLELVPGLMQERFSRFRAKWLTNNPSPDQPGEFATSFFGWSQDSMMLAQIHNAVIAVNAGKKAKDLMILAPRAKREKLFAPTIADFSVGKFMSVINNSK